MSARAVAVIRPAPPSSLDSLSFDSCLAEGGQLHAYRDRFESRRGRSLVFINGARDRIATIEETNARNEVGVAPFLNAEDS